MHGDADRTARELDLITGGRDELAARRHDAAVVLAADLARSERAFAGAVASTDRVVGARCRGARLGVLAAVARAPAEERQRDADRDDGAPTRSSGRR
jgi:hypothetical protein